MENKIGTVQRGGIASTASGGSQSWKHEEDEEDEVDELYRCPLQPNATSEEKRGWVLQLGRHLLFSGAIALPVLRWDGGTEEESLVSASHNRLDRGWIGRVADWPLRALSQVIDRVGFLFDSYKGSSLAPFALDLQDEFVFVLLFFFIFFLHLCF